MGSSAQAEGADTRVRDVAVSEDERTVALMDGRTIAVPLAWYPRLANGTPEQRAHREVAGGGYGIHWPGRGCRAGRHLFSNVTSRSCHFKA